MADRVMRETAHMRATIADMREPVLARCRSAMMGEALSATVSDVTGVREMPGAPRVDAARVDRATVGAADVTDMHSAPMPDMHPATVSEMRAAAVRGKTAKMRCPTAAKVGPATTKVRCPTAAEMRRAAAKVDATAATEMGRSTAAKVGPAATEMGATTATTKMRRGDCERKGGDAKAQSGRQSNNNPTRHSTTPTV
jgi:hypothetical protein